MELLLGIGCFFSLITVVLEKIVDGIFKAVISIFKIFEMNKSK